MYKNKISQTALTRTQKERIQNYTTSDYSNLSKRLQNLEKSYWRKLQMRQVVGSFKPVTKSPEPSQLSRLQQHQKQTQQQRQQFHQHGSQLQPQVQQPIYLPTPIRHLKAWKQVLSATEGSQITPNETQTAVTNIP